MRRRVPLITLFLAAIVVAEGTAPPAYADGKATVARELGHLLARKLGAKAVAKGGQALSRRAAVAASHHADDVARAVKRIGPRALTLANEAGEHAPQVMQFVAKHGAAGAAVMTKQSSKLLASLGDDAGVALLRHNTVVVPMLEKYGATAARALTKVTPQNGRRLIMMAKTFDRGQTAVKVVEVVAKHGDAVVNWMWANKGALAATAAVTAFLADPESFMNGTKKLTESVSKQIVVPLSSAVINGGVKIGDSFLQHAVKPAVTEMSRAAARSIPWGTVIVTGLVSLGGLAAVVAWRLRLLGLAWAAFGRRSRQPAPAL